MDCLLRIEYRYQEMLVFWPERCLLARAAQNRHLLERVHSAVDITPMILVIENPILWFG